MEKTTIESLGKYLSTIAMVLTGLGAFIISMVHTFPADAQNMINTGAIFLVAVGTYLAHKNQEVA